jgi:hypothetical protein
MKEARVAALAEELKETINRANRIIAILEKKNVTVRVWNKTTSDENKLEIVDIIQKVEY